MPLQNRVLPTGEIVAIPERGTLTGNRGIIHGPDKGLTNKRWSHHAWISCELDWKDWRREVMTGRKWTELFFLDEAVALAAGHRPCGYCRRADYAAFKAAWAQAIGPSSAKEMDKVLHAARIDPKKRRQRTHQRRAFELPTGTMYGHQDAMFLKHGTTSFLLSAQGYVDQHDHRDTLVEVLTPAPLVAVLAAGYVPRLHPNLPPYSAAID